MGANRNTEQRYKLFVYLLSIIKKNRFYLLLTINRFYLMLAKNRFYSLLAKNRFFCVSTVSTLLLLAIFPLAKNIRFIQFTLFFSKYTKKSKRLRATAPAIVPCKWTVNKKYNKVGQYHLLIYQHHMVGFWCDKTTTTTKKRCFWDISYTLL